MSRADEVFETAVDAIVNGDLEKLQRLLHDHPDLIRARSAREHRATLLHYVAANGVEDERQKTPPNIVAIARLLLDAGADVDAGAPMYGGDCTTLGLAATSVHPAAAGVQEPLLQLLLDRGADPNRISAAGRRHTILFACFANGRPKAAAYLANHGARVDFISAAALGRTDLVEGLFDERLKDDALRYACEYADVKTVQLLLDKGADIAAGRDRVQTPLHMAVIGGNVDVVRFLLQLHAPLDARNEHGGTPLGQAFWSAGHGGDPEEYRQIIEALTAAGSRE